MDEEMSPQDMLNSLAELCQLGMAESLGKDEYKLLPSEIDYVETVLMGHLEDSLEIYAAGRLQGLREQSTDRGR